MSNIISVSEQRGKFHIWRDETRGSVLVDLDGFWTPYDMACFLPPLAAEVERSRTRHGYALSLFDTSKNQVIGGALVDGFREDGAKLIKPSDRVAIVFASSLLKIQMKRMTPSELNYEFFASRNAADLWLHAEVKTSI